MENRRVEFFWNRESVVEILIWVAVFLLLTVSSFPLDFYLSFSLSIVLLIGMILLSLFNRKFIIPFFLSKERFFWTLLFTVVIIVLMTIVFSFLEERILYYFIEKNRVASEVSLLDISLPEERKPFFEEESIVSLLGNSQTTKWKILILFLGVTLVNFLSFYRQRSLAAEQVRNSLLQEKMQMELNFLRSQINPHFLFNAMNNLYSLVYMKDKNAPDAILSLSEMLRYVTNCSKNNEILLEKEILYLENYIDFHRFSFENPLDITFEKYVESESIMIAPMLLQPFLENSFKYSGVGREDDSYILLSLNATHNQLHFYIENTICEKFRTKKEFSNGVGLQNVQQRLKLCYPNRYVLSVNELNNIYQLDLVINLK